MTEAEQIMKRCQVGTRNYNEANNLHAECYRVIGKLLKTIEDMESKESNPIKDGWQLSVADGHSGYGVYAHMNEYPEEGAFLLLPIKELESQEPVAWMDADGNVSDNNDHKCFPIPLYTHPPQRTWQGLTDEDIRPLCKEWWMVDTAKQWVAIIEAKLKERNS